MPKIRPLTPEQAKCTLGNRFGPLVDRLRQIPVNFGLRSQRVFLVWSKYTGEERGEGTEVEVRCKEILPTPEVSPMNAISFLLATGGTMPVGTMQVKKVSMSFTNDELEGLYVPVNHEDIVPQPYRFYYEMAEDGRGDRQPLRQRFRLAAKPWRNENAFSWELLLERVSEDPNRSGRTRDE